MARAIRSTSSSRLACTRCASRSACWWIITSIRNLFSGFSIIHREDVQNQTIIFHNYSTTLCEGASIIPSDREHASLPKQRSWTFLQEGTQLHCLFGLSSPQRLSQAYGHACLSPDLEALTSLRTAGDGS